MVTDLILVVILSLISQTVVDQLKLAVKFHSGKWFKERVNLKVLTAMIVSLVLCVAYSINLMTLLGLVGNELIGEIITGVIVSGGATATHDLIGKIKEVREGK